jgi:hypothetical protein
MATNWVEIIGFTPASEATALAILATLGGSPGVKFEMYGEALGVATGIPTVVVSYTVPATKKLILTVIQGAATSRAEFVVAVDAATVAKRYSQITTLTADFLFGPNGLEVAAGSTVDVTITQNRPGTADLNANMVGLLETA